MIKRQTLSIAACVFLGAILLGAMCGCGVGRPLLVGERAEIINMAAIERTPVDCEVSVSPAALLVPAAGETEDAYVAYGNAQMLSIDEAIKSVLTEFGLFSEVVPAAEATNPYFEIAAQVTKYEIAYKGRNGVYIPNLVCWCFSPWASWMVADENYSATLSVNVSVKDSDADQEVWGEPIEVEVVKALSDYQRGTKWFSIYSIGTLTTDNWTLVEETLREHVLEEFKAKLLERLLSAEVQSKIHESAQEIKFRRLPEVDWAIVVGVNSCPQLGKKFARWCVASAKRLATTLKGRGYDEVLELHDVTVADIKAALEKAGAQKDARMVRLLFYFAGVGASVYKPGEKAIEQSLLDCEGEVLSLAELAGLVEKVNARQRMVIIDAGFMPDSLGRGIRQNEIPEGMDARFPAELASGNCGFLSACGPGQGAAEDDDLKACLFTHYMLKAISDGAASLKGIFESESVSFDLVRHSGFKFGASQQPFLGEKQRTSTVIKTKK